MKSEPVHNLVKFESLDPDIYSVFVQLSASIYLLNAFDALQMSIVPEKYHQQIGVKIIMSFTSAIHAKLRSITNKASEILLDSYKIINEVILVSSFLQNALSLKNIVRSDASKYEGLMEDISKIIKDNVSKLANWFFFLKFGLFNYLYSY